MDSEFKDQVAAALREAVRGAAGKPDVQKVGMFQEAPGQRSVRRVVYFWSFVLGWATALLLVWRGDGATARDLIIGLVVSATGGVATGRWAEAYESKKNEGGENE